MNKLKKIMLTLVLLASTAPVVASAANMHVSVKADKTNVKPGDTVTITMTPASQTTEINATYNISGPGVLGESHFMGEGTKTTTIKVNGEGTIVFSMTPNGLATDSELNEYSVTSDAVTITSKAPAPEPTPEPKPPVVEKPKPSPSPGDGGSSEIKPEVPENKPAPKPEVKPEPKPEVEAPKPSYGKMIKSVTISSGNYKETYEMDASNRVEINTGIPNLIYNVTVETEPGITTDLSDDTIIEISGVSFSTEYAFKASYEGSEYLEETQSYSILVTRSDENAETYKVWSGEPGVNWEITEVNAITSESVHESLVDYIKESNGERYLELLGGRYQVLSKESTGESAWFRLNSQGEIEDRVMPVKVGPGVMDIAFLSYEGHKPEGKIGGLDELIDGKMFQHQSIPMDDMFKISGLIIAGGVHGYDLGPDGKIVTLSGTNPSSKVQYYIYKDETLTLIETEELITSADSSNMMIIVGGAAAAALLVFGVIMFIKKRKENSDGGVDMAKIIAERHVGLSESDERELDSGVLTDPIGHYSGEDEPFDKNNVEHIILGDVTLDEDRSFLNEMTKHAADIKKYEESENEEESEDEETVETEENIVEDEKVVEEDSDTTEDGIDGEENAPTRAKKLLDIPREEDNE